MAAAGASYVSRWTTYHVFPLVKAIKEALQVNGFSFVEIISQCPVSYGKLVNMRKASDFLRFYKDHSVNVQKTRDMNEEELKDKIIIGKLTERNREEFVSTLRRINENVRSQWAN